MKRVNLCGFIVATLMIVCLALPYLLGQADGDGSALLAAETATATVRWPSWTPLPTNTPRVYPTWTPLPTATSRRSATPTVSRTATKSATAQFTPGVNSTATPTPGWTPETPPQTCSQPWVFTYNERLNIQAAALFLWQEEHGPRDDLTQPALDPILSIGLYGEQLGAPLTDEFALLSDDGAGKIRCRAFALGIVAMMERDDLQSECVNYCVVGWNGEAWK